MLKITSIDTRDIPCSGTCEICHTENVILRRTYFRYENIKCECHSPYHFDLIDHCYDCIPKIPSKTIVEYSVDNSEKAIRKIKLEKINKNE